MYGLTIFGLAILRLYYIYSSKRDKRCNIVKSKGLDHLINSDEFDGEYIDDVPVKDDLFNIDPFLSSLAERIRAVNNSTSNVLGLVGPWGSGKTTALRLALEKHIDDEYELIEFDAWSDVGGRSAIVNLMEAIVSKTPGVSKHSLSMKEFVRSLTASGNSWISLSGLILDSSLKDASDSLRSELNAALNKKKKHLLIVIDNLDRASEDTVKGLMAALNGVFRIENTTFVLLYDAKNILNHVEPLYCDKIIIHPVYVPPVSPYQYQRVLSVVVTKIVPKSVDHQSMIGVLNQISLIITTPRDLVIATNIIIGVTKQPYQYFSYPDMVAARFIEHFNNRLYHELLESWQFVCTRNSGYTDLKYTDHRTKFLSHIKEDYSDYWGLICELLQITEFNDQFSDKSKIRDYSIKDALYYPVYMHGMASDFHETDALFDSLVSNGYKSVESVVDIIISDPVRYDFRHFARRIEYTYSSIPPEFRTDFAAVLMKNSQKIYTRGSSNIDYLCRKILFNQSIQAHREFLSAVQKDYSNLFNLSHMYYGMERESENTEEIRQLYLDFIVSMRKEIFNGPVDLYHDYYSKYNIWGLESEENRAQMDEYLPKIVIDSDSAVKFLSDLMVEQYSYSIDGTIVSRSISNDNVSRISSEEFVRNVFSMIDPKELNEDQLAVYNDALSYINRNNIH